MKNSTLKAPTHLRPDTKAWWQSVHQDYDLEEPYLLSSLASYNPQRFHKLMASSRRLHDPWQ
jgi:hypothetical protein